MATGNNSLVFYINSKPMWIIYYQMKYSYENEKIFLKFV